MKMKNFLIIVGSSALLISCGAILKGAVMPNQCKKCEVIDRATNTVVSVFEGCGSENIRLEEQAKEAAFDLIKSSNNCNIDVVCESWKNDPEG